MGVKARRYISSGHKLEVDLLEPSVLEECAQLYLIKSHPHVGTLLAHSLVIMSDIIDNA
jgi:hypothetical protein